MSAAVENPSPAEPTTRSIATIAAGQMRYVQPFRGGEPELLELDTLDLQWARRYVPLGTIENLADDIAANGLQQAIFVAANRRRVVGGTNRTRAFLLNRERFPGDPRWGRIPAVVLAELDTEEMCLRWLMSGDVQTTRHPLDTAFLIQDFSQKHPDLSDAAIATALNLHPVKLCRLKKALDYDPDILELIRTGGLLMEHLLAVSGMRDRAARHEVLRRAAVAGQSAKATREEVTRPKGTAARSRLRQLKVGEVTVTWPVGWRLEQLVAAVEEFLAFVRGQVKTFDPKAVELGLVLPKG